MLLLVSTQASAAPRVVSMFISSPQSTQFFYTSVGASQVEYAWPRSGIVCRNDRPRTPSVVLGCGNQIGSLLEPNVRYKIIDFNDGSSTTFLLADNGYRCIRTGNGNFINFVFGQRETGQYFVSWQRRIRNSWVQLQLESDNGGEPIKIYEGFNNIAYNVKPNQTYRVKDLTYGGRTTIELKEGDARGRCG